MSNAEEYAEKFALAMMRATLCALLCAACMAGAQQTYPSKPVRLIVGFAPGGGTDILARALGPPLGELLGQQVTIDARLV